MLAGLESSDVSSKLVSPESLSCLSALVDEEEEDEELPSILSHQGEKSVNLYEASSPKIDVLF